MTFKNTVCNSISRCICRGRLLVASTACKQRGLGGNQPGAVLVTPPVNAVSVMSRSLFYRLRRRRSYGPWGPPCWCLGLGLPVWLFTPARSMTSGSSAGSWCMPCSSPSSAALSSLPAPTPTARLPASWLRSSWGCWRGSLPWASPPSSATQAAPWWTGPTVSSSPLKRSPCFSPWGPSLLFHTWLWFCFRETSFPAGGMFAISWGEPAPLSPCGRWRNRGVHQMLG